MVEFEKYNLNNDWLEKWYISQEDPLPGIQIVQLVKAKKYVTIALRNAVGGLHESIMVKT